MKDEWGRKAIELGDTTTHGGLVITANCKSADGGKALAGLGDLVFCPKCMRYTTIVGDDADRFNRIGAFAVEGQSTCCGARLMPGPPVDFEFIIRKAFQVLHAKPNNSRTQSARPGWDKPPQPEFPDAVNLACRIVEGIFHVLENINH